MTQDQARKETKYFGAGVRVGVWCYSGDGNWNIVVQRGEQIDFMDWDGLGRSILLLFSRAAKGEPLELNRPPSCYSDHASITFESFDDAKECISEIGRALDYLRTKSKETCWQPIPLNLFELFAATAQVETVGK